MLRKTIESYGVQCSCCGAVVGKDTFPTEEAAIAAWNRRASGWISVEDRLPDFEDDVLVVYRCDGQSYVKTACYIAGSWSSLYDEYRISNQEEIITHWQPLPEPPEVDNKNESD